MQRTSTPSHRPHLPISLVAISVLAASVFGGALTYLFWREWLAFAASYPIVADVLRFVLFAAPVLLAVGYGVTGLTIWYRRWGWKESIFADKQIALKKAEVQIAPLATSFNYHDSRQNVEPDLEQEEADTELPQLPLDPRKTVFEQLIVRGDIDRSGRSLLVGYAADQTPQYIEMDSCSTIIVGGQPRAGKTSTVKLLLAQAAYMGWHIAVADPHIRKKDGLLNVCQPISGAFIKQAVEPDEIAAMIRWVDKIGQKRLDGDKIDAPVLLVIDEFSNVVLREWVPKDVLALLAAMTMAYAGVQVHMLIIGHDFSAKLLGGSLGTSLRRATTHRIVHKIAADAAEMILPSAAWGRVAADLGTGSAVYWGEGSPLPLTVPWIQGEDLIVAARGRAPKPYALRQLPAAPAPVQQRVITSGLPPTQRVPSAHLRAAPPTAPMVITIQEQIVDLLRITPDWLTSGDIAQALRAEPGTIANALTKLSRAKTIQPRRSQRPGRETYEYSADPISITA